MVIDCCFEPFRSGWVRRFARVRPSHRSIASKDVLHLILKRGSPTLILAIISLFPMYYLIIYVNHRSNMRVHDLSELLADEAFGFFKKNGSPP